jgi:AcrR family transcriptional regulator
MSRKERSTSPRKPANNAKRRMPDLRIRRTRGRLSNALIELMRDKPIDQITVQEVLELAAVGRSTFYLHYRDKNDLLLDLMENGLEMWSNSLSKTNEKSHRLVPVEEFFAHAGSAMKFYRALIDSGRIHAFFDLAEGCFARGIARRLMEIKAPNPSVAKIAERELDARSHALAGNLLSLLKWWLDHGARESPKAMDELFHRIAWTGLQ